MDDSFSAVAEDQFFSFSAFRPRPKCFFYCFSPVGHGRKPIFAVFYPSAAAETQNLPVFDFPPRLKTNFRRFLDFIHGYECFLRFLRFAYERNAVFSVFRSSLASETLFLAISVFRSRATNDFLHFLAFQGVGNAACGVF